MRLVVLLTVRALKVFTKKVQIFQIFEAVQFAQCGRGYGFW